jgi:hypothetical protein
MPLPSASKRQSLNAVIDSKATKLLLNENLNGFN